MGVFQPSVTFPDVIDQCLGVVGNLAAGSDDAIRFRLGELGACQGGCGAQFTSLQTPAICLR